jgi:predicted RNase H-like HicB family nuclease
MRLCVRVRQDDSGRYIAACPSLPGCVSSGQTERQARQNLEEAITGYLASLNDFVPERIRDVVEYQS